MIDYHSKYKSVVWLIATAMIVHVILGFAIYLISPDRVMWLVRNDLHWGVFIVSLSIASIILDDFENRRKKKYRDDLDKP